MFSPNLRKIKMLSDNPNNHMNIKYFDTLEYVQKSEEIKNPRDLAEFQVKQMESALETVTQYVKNDYTSRMKNFRSEINNRNLATKNELFEVKNELKSDIKDLRSELKGDIKNLRYETLKFVVWTGVSVIVSVGGMMIGLFTAIAHGFHWI